MPSHNAEVVEEPQPTGFVRKSAFSFVGQVVTFACNFGVGILIARLLGADGKGAYALISSTVAIVLSIVTMGMPFAATFFVGRHKWAPVPTMVLACACSVVPLGILLLVMTLVGPEHIFRTAAFSQEAIRLTWLMLLLAVPMQIVSGVIVAVLRGRELIVETVWPTMVVRSARIILIAVLLVVVRRELVSAVFADLATSALGLALIVLVFQGAMRTWPTYSAKPILTHLLSYGLKGQAGGILFILWFRADLYLVNYFRGQAAAGQYSVAMALAEFAAFPTIAITSVLFPRLSLSGSEVRLEQTMRAHRAVAILSFATGAVLAGAAFLIPVVYGRSFAPAIVPALVCLGGCVFWAGIRVLHYFFLAEDRQMLAVAADAVGAVCMISLDLLLIPRLGISGAAAAYGVSLVVTYGVTLWLGFRVGLLSHPSALVPRWRDGSAVCEALRAAVWRGAGKCLSSRSDREEPG